MINHTDIKRFSWCILLLGCLSCNKDFLDPANPGAITDDDVWNDENLIEMYVNGLYNSRPGYDYLNTLDNITDEARCNYPDYDPNRILVGQWDQVSNPMDNWGSYGSVRATNEFLARIDGTPIEEAAKKRMKGEARFLRAFLYFDLVIRYGGVPIIDKPQGLDDDLEVSRNTLDECFAFIDRELDSSILELPDDAPRGRASRGAAMALQWRLKEDWHYSMPALFIIKRMRTNAGKKLRMPVKL